MNLNKIKILFVVALAFFAIGCEEEQDCVAKENPDCFCPQNYDPVCGCDGVTYSNACAASCVGISAVKGACGIDKEILQGDYEFLGYQKQDNISLTSPVKKHKYEIDASFGDTETAFKVNGKASINFYGGAYEVKSSRDQKGQVSISSFGTTKIGGTPDDLIYEANYWANMSATTNYELKGNLLVLKFNFEGNQDQMIFKKK
ncbi:MAG: Kazal-type serine protease inhibitor family protein [Saprospiraceae bacterium]|nr:META domain-containing protein [Saprospiraceae bacterium]